MVRVIEFNAFREACLVCSRKFQIYIYIYIYIFITFIMTGALVLENMSVISLNYL